MLRNARDLTPTRSRSRRVAVLVVVAASAVMGCSGEDEAAPTTSTTTTQVSENSTISALLPLDTQFEDLNAIVAASDMDETLSAEGPITLLAPTNDAFPETGDDSVESLVADPTRATALINGLILDGAVTTDDLIGLDGASTGVTAAGATWPVALVDGRVEVGGSPILKADIRASNGVILAVGALPTAGADSAG